MPSRGGYTSTWGVLWDSSGSAAVLMLLAIGRQEIIRVNASKTREMQLGITPFSKKELRIETAERLENP